MKRHYDQAFKQEAVRLALTGDKSIAETARSLGIKEATLYNWVYQVKSSPAKVPSEEFNNSAELVNELNRLRKENARLKEEREILKKAAAYSSGQCNKRRKFIKWCLKIQSFSRSTI
jgi:transposase